MVRFVFFALALFSVASWSFAAPARPKAPEPPTDTLRPIYPSAEAVLRYAQARLSEERGDDAAAMAEYYRVLALDPRSLSAARNLSELSGRRGEAARSLEFADRALALEPGDAQSLWLKGSAQFNLGRPAEALETLEAATRADSTRAQLWLTLARVAESQDRIPVVARAYASVVRLDEDDAEAWFQLAAAEARLGHFGLADSALTHAVELNPMRPGEVFLRGWIRESTGRRAEAISLYRHHLELHPDDQVTRSRLVDLLARERRPAEAWEEARRLARARPGDPDVLQGEADLAFKSGHPHDAAETLDRMRRMAPDDPAMTARALVVLGQNGREGEAVTLAEAWAHAHPGNFRGDMLVAQGLAMNHQMDAAIEHARRAASAVPDSLAPRILLGRFYQTEKRYAEAEPVWVDALSRFPQLIGVGLDLAYCREQRGNLDGSESAVRDVLKREPRNPTALNFLGYLLADHNRKLDEAETLIQQAVDQEPDNGAFLDSLGWVYYRLGRYQEARAKLERAVDITGDAVVREHLGDVYKVLKLLDLARDQYARALASDSSNTRLRNKLAEIR